VADSAVSSTTGGFRKLTAQATAIAITAMIRPVTTAPEALLPIATPPITEPTAMPALAEEAGSADASWRDARHERDGDE
jgi:hypothetical protein